MKLMNPYHVFELQDFRVTGIELGLEFLSQRHGKGIGILFYLFYLS